MGIRWPFCGTKQKGPKTINIFLGFFFMVNFCLGTGFLGIPFSFFYAGYLASIPTLLLIAFVSWNNAEWTIETMSRAQALEHWQKERDEKAQSSDSESEREKLIASGISSAGNYLAHPRYEIRLTRKFEPTELCEIFLSRWGKALYITILTVYSFLVCWSFTTVAGSAWATNIPFSSSSLQRCGSEDFLHVLIPADEACRNSYMLCVFFFAVIAVPLSLVDLKEQAFLQMILGLLRFATIAGIVLYSIVSIGEGGDGCPISDGTNDTRNESYWNLSNASMWTLSGSSGYADFSDIVFRFDPKGWLVSTPVFAYAFILHQGIPALTHPIREKHLLRQLMVAMFSIATISYLSLGVVVPLWFKANIQETCTLNWVDTAKSGSPGIRALSYYLVLFPSVDVTSAYPLVVHTISNNIYTTLFCRDTSRKSKTPKLDFVLQLVIKFIAASLPIAAALLVSNLVYILKYAGLTGFFISFFFPTALQLSSIWRCSKEFPPHSHSGTRTRDHPTGSVKKHVYDLQNGPLVADKECSGASVQSRISLMFSSYRTPFSNRLLSHPVSVVLIGGVGVLLFLLTVTSLAVHPRQLYCSDEL